MQANEARTCAIDIRDTVGKESVLSTLVLSPCHPLNLGGAWFKLVQTCLMRAHVVEFHFKRGD